jgi:hypothetical protein
LKTVDLLLRNFICEIIYCDQKLKRPRFRDCCNSDSHEHTLHAFAIAIVTIVIPLQEPHPLAPISTIHVGV